MTLYSDLRGFIKEYVTKFRWPNDRGYKLLISLNTSKFPTQFAQFMFFPQCVVVLISAQFQGLLYPVLFFFFFCLSLFEVCSFHFSFHWLLGLSIFSHIYCSLFSEFHVCSFIPVFTIGLFAFLWSQQSQLWVVDHCISLQTFISPSTAAEHLCQIPGTLETNTEINQASVLQLSGVSLETQK